MTGKTTKLDDSEWTKALDLLGGEAKESLARRMVVEGGVLVRDEARLIAASRKPNRVWSAPRGLLASAVYLAKNDKLSTEDVFTYSVSWNHKKAPHGWWIEMGRYQRYMIKWGKRKGGWYTIKAEKLPTPKWVPPTPFLRPAYDGRGDDAIKVMIERGRKEFPILMAEIKAKTQ
jgi:hypothetical protein